MKIWKDNISLYPFVQKTFQENFDDKEIFLFIEGEMPHVRNAIKKLLSKF